MTEQTFNQQIYDSVVQLNQNSQNQQAAILQLYSQIEQQNEVIKSLQQNQDVSRLHQAVEAIIENANKQNQINKDLDNKIDTVNNNMIEYIKKLDQKIGGIHTSNESDSSGQIEELKKQISNHASKTSIQVMIQELTNQIQKQLQDMAQAVQKNLEILQTSDVKLEEGLNKQASSISEVIEYSKQLANKIEQVEKNATSSKSGNNNTTQQKIEMQGDFKEKFISLENDFKNMKAQYEQQIFELQQKLNNQNEIVGKIQMNSLKVVQQLNENQKVLKEKLQNLKKNEIDEKNKDEIQLELEKRISSLEELKSEFNEFKSKQLAIFANQDDLESVQQKFKNLKVNIRKQIEQLNKNINDDKEDKNAFIKDINSKIETVETIQQAINEQLKTSNNINSSTNIDAIEFNEMKVKLRKLDETKVTANELNEKLKRIEEASIEQRKDYTNRISNLEFISSKEKEEINDNIKALEEKFETTFKTVNDTPRMISKSIEENEIALSDFKEKIKGKIIDMKAKLDQAKFADEEIDELRKIVQELTESTKQKFEAIDLLFDENKRMIENRKLNEEDISKHEEEIKMLKTTIENLLSKCGINPEDQSNELIINSSATIDLINNRLNRIEEHTRANIDNILRSSESINNLKDNEGKLVKQIRSEVNQFKDSIPYILSSTEEFLSMKRELQIVQRTLNDCVEDFNEEKEQMKEKLSFIDRFSNSFVLPEVGDISESETPKRDEVISKSSMGEINMKIDGVDLSTQRQIRKLRRSIRKIQKDLDDKKSNQEHDIKKERRHHHKNDETKNVEEEKEEIELHDEEKTQLLPARSPINSLLNGMEQNDYELLFILMFTVLFYFLISDLF